MTTRVTRQFKARRILAACLCSFGLFAAAQSASAQLAYVPRNVTVFVGPGANLGGADTAYSAALRGQGQLLQGQGAYLQGMGCYLQGMGQYQKDLQTVHSMTLDNRQKYLSLHRAHEQQRQQDEQVRLLAARQRHQQNQWARLGNRASTQSVSSGETLNLLWETLGSRVEKIPFQNMPLTKQDLAAVRLKCREGFTFDKLAKTLDANGQVQWPEALRRLEFHDLRHEIEQSLSKILQTEMENRDAQPMYQQATRHCQALEKLARKTLAHDGMVAWQSARDFCGDLRQILTMSSFGGLARAEAVLSYQANDTVDLIQHMRRFNLRFAPTTDGFGVAYHALHEKLADAHQSLTAGSHFARR